MKKLVLFLITLFLINGVFAEDVAYIVKTSSNSNIVGALNELGYTYNVITDSSIPTTDFSQYSVLLIQDDVSNKALLPLATKNSIFIDKNIAVATWTGISIGVTNAFSSKLEQLSTPFTDGFSSVDFNAYTTTKSVYYLDRKTSSITNIANSIGASSYGKPIVSYSNVNHIKNVFFGFYDITYWTSDTKKLFKNSVKWIITQQCTDADGDYYVKENLNPNICENICGPLNNGVCLGNNDCNDNDANINPGSTDPSERCNNGAPTMNAIANLEVHETDTIVVSIDATDPEGDNLMYSINDSRFIQDTNHKNMFVWRTSYGNKGTYSFKASVTDGSLSDSKDFQVNILKTNRVPVCTNIPLLTWDEDNEFSLNLNNYCSDADRDSMTFSLYQKSDGSHISLKSLNNGIAVFSPEKNWFGGSSGEEWVIFKVSDGVGEIQTNQVKLRVNPVNDAPVFDKNIEDQTWNQETNLLNKINLKDYFSDVDNLNPSFTVSGNTNIQVIINANGVVSFYPMTDWYGIEKVVFSASDGEFTANSNQVTLEVLKVNRPPVFNQLDCNTDILEETNESCELSATDPENDPIVFSVVRENNLKCFIQDNVLDYVSYKDFAGNATCTIRASDSNGSYSDLVFSVNVQAVNDAPVIKDYSPKLDYVKIISGTSKIFSVIVFDADVMLKKVSQILNIRWTIDGNAVGNLTDYTFNKTNGDYNLTAFVDDGEYNVYHSWNVSVKDIMFFTCSEVQGNICSSEQICSQNFLGVYDSDRCCPVACTKSPPAFKSIKKIDINKSDSMILNINYVNPTIPDINDTMRVNFDIENAFANDMNVDLEIYLYDITKDKVIQETKDSFRMAEGIRRTLNYDLKIDYNVNETNEYAVLVRAIAESNDHTKYYNENYREISLNRKDHEVIINNFNVFPERDLVCGDTIKADIDVKNIGENDEFVLINIDNSDLNIHEKITNSLLIERYNNDDEIKKSFDITIPDNAKSGIYTMRATVSYRDTAISIEKEIVLGECMKESSEIKDVGTIKINNLDSSKIEQKNTDNRKIIFLVLNVISLMFMLVLIVAGQIYRKKLLMNNSKAKGKKVRRK